MFLFIPIALALLFSVYAEAKVETYSGEAKRDGKTVYTEKHIVRYDAGGNVIEAETTYRNTKGDVISVLKSDFRSSLTAPDHVITNLRTGNVQGLRTSREKIILFNKDDGKAEETKELAITPNESRIAFGCQGLNYYLLKNLDEFQQKQSLPIRFLIPGDLDAYNFEIKFVREVDGIVEIEIEIDNWFLSLFAPKLKVKYDTKKKRIIWYEGLSNIKGEDGKNQSVTIVYSYED